MKKRPGKKKSKPKNKSIILPANESAVDGASLEASSSEAEENESEEGEESDSDTPDGSDLQKTEVSGGEAETKSVEESAEVSVKGEENATGSEPGPALEVKTGEKAEEPKETEGAEGGKVAAATVSEEPEAGSSPGSEKSHDPVESKHGTGSHGHHDDEESSPFGVLDPDARPLHPQVAAQGSEGGTAFWPILWFTLILAVIALFRTIDVSMNAEKSRTHAKLIEKTGKEVEHLAHEVELKSADFDKKLERFSAKVPELEKTLTALTSQASELKAALAQVKAEGERVPELEKGLGQLTGKADSLDRQAGQLVAELGQLKTQAGVQGKSVGEALQATQSLSRGQEALQKQVVTLSEKLVDSAKKVVAAQEAQKARQEALERQVALLPEASRTASDGDVPVGTIVIFWGQEPPEGWLLCNGAELPEEEAFSTLRGLIGDRAPDLSKMHLEGIQSDDGEAVGQEAYLAVRFIIKY